jgi:sigma-B regulation protein RsbU (phosphoserine phosphatase)
MTAVTELFERVRRLSAFDGDARAALPALHAHFAADFPDCSVALLLVRGEPPGRCRLAGLIGPDGTEHVPNLDPNGERGELPLFDDALARRIVENVAPHVIAVPPPERASPLAQALFAPASVLAVPLANAGALSHWLAFGSTLARRFTGTDLERALLHVNLAASLIVRPIALKELTRESERRRHEIESLAEIQKRLLPDNPRIRGLAYAVHWQPAATAAGDYYEMTNLTAALAPPGYDAPADLWGVIVADVSGHGAAAAMEAVQFDAILRTYRGGGDPPAAAMSYANRYFFSRRSRGHFMTVFAMLYRPDTRLLHYLSAGHPPALHRRGRTVRLLGEADQIPIGVLRDYQYHNHSLALAPGDLLVLYTDGVVEARDGRDAPFGLDRLRELVAAGPAEPEALRDDIVAALRAHQQGAVGSDDQTLVVLRIDA